MGTSLQVQNLTAEHFGGEQYNGCNDYLVISYPEAVEIVHHSFLEVGVDVLENGHLPFQSHHDGGIQTG